MNLQAITPTLILILLLVLLALVLLLLFLWLRESRSRKGSHPKPADEHPPTDEGSLPLPRVEYIPKDFFVQDEIILSGSLRIINRLVASIANEVTLIKMDAETEAGFIGCLQRGDIGRVIAVAFFETQ